MVKTTFSRISAIVRSNVNEILDHLEDPEKMVRQMVRDMEVEVDRVVSAVGTAVASVRRLEKEQDHHQTRSATLQARAQRALEAGDEELARQALECRVLVDEAAAGLQPALDEGRRTAEMLRAKLSCLRTDLEDARQRQGSLIARIRARSRTQTLADPERSGDPLADFERLGRRLEHNRGEFERMRQRLELSEVAEEASSEARRELLGEDAAVGRRFEELEMRQRVDKELAALRGQAVAEDQK